MAAPGHQDEPLSAVDAAWLHMDRTTNLMMICGMMMLDGHLELSRLKGLIRTRMLCIHRFRQRVAGPASRPYWECDPHFDLDWHVRRIASGAGTLEEVASDLISTPLDRARPMWQWHLVEGVHNSALIMRIHHCYGDGFAMLHVVEGITDLSPHTPRAGHGDLPGANASRSALERILGPAAVPLGDAVRGALALADTGGRLLLHPGNAVSTVRSGARLLCQAGAIASMTPDSPTRLKGELGAMKRAAWAEPLALGEVKALACAFSCSVNDVLVACITGALRAYLFDHGDAVDGKEIRALVPVNLRPPGPISELGNRFGLVFLELPIGIDDPLARLQEVHRRMEVLKQSQQAQVALGILAGMGVAPDFLKERILDALAANASMVVTNVRGPEQPRWLAGRRITREVFWVPQSGGIGLGISILSYAGQVSFAVVSDVRRIPNPSAIMQRVAAQFEALVLAALLSPWPGEKTQRPAAHGRADRA